MIEILILIVIHEKKGVFDFSPSPLLPLPVLSSADFKTTSNNGVIQSYKFEPDTDSQEEDGEILVQGHLQVNE